MEQGHQAKAQGQEEAWVEAAVGAGWEAIVPAQGRVVIAFALIQTAVQKCPIKLAALVII